MSNSNNDLQSWVRSITALYIFRILSDGPAYGNKIAAEIRSRTTGRLNPNTNALYPLLHIMEERGYIIGKWEKPNTRSKRIYTITAGGIARIPFVEQKVRERLNDMELLVDVLREDLLDNQ